MIFIGKIIELNEFGLAGRFLVEISLCQKEISVIGNCFDLYGPQDCAYYLVIVGYKGNSKAHTNQNNNEHQFMVAN